MKPNQILQGHALEVLRTLPDECVDMVITSPPYWSKRNYETEPILWGGNPTCEHEWIKSREAPTKFGTYGYHTNTNDRANEMRYESGNICKKCGAWVGSLGLEPTIMGFVNNLTSIFDEVHRILANHGSLYLNIGDTYYGTGTGHKPDGTGKHGCYPLDSLITKEKPFKNGEISSKCLSMIPQRVALALVRRGWVLRNVIIWHKPNAMPESAKDRFTNDFEYLYFFTKNTKYYFEQQFEPYTEPINRWAGTSLKADGSSEWDEGTGQERYRDRDMRPNDLGRNKRAVWSINTKPFKDAHFATFPVKLLEIPIKASCPEGGIILDPFMGSGTTAVVAKALGRDYLGIELNPDYIKIAEKRLRTPIRKVQESMDLPDIPEVEFL